MFLRTIAALTLTAAPALADPVSGFYVSGHAAISAIDEQKIEDVDTGFGPQPGGRLSTDTGYGAGIAAGWGFGNGWRTELELTYRRANFDLTTAGALKDAATDGHYGQTSVFVNALYDFHSVKGPIRPYLGGGVGISRVAWNDTISYVPGERVGHDTHDTSPAAQIMVGASWDVPSAQGLTLSAELRHVRLLDDLSYDGRVLESRFGSFPITTNVNETRRTEVLITLRRSF